ncbi:MAG TPA: NADH-quinone oxidoreductase subunit N [Ktedonobacteraceae bacterium]|nr:NADH-quinone oxidoreductase subunit N [Ktedonobacteraceae bacterium]
MTFTYYVTAADWGRIAPELILAGVALLVLIVDLLLPQAGVQSKDSGPRNFVVLPLISLLGIVAALVATITLFVVGDHQRAFNEMIGSDTGSLYAYIIILSASFLGVLLSPAYLKRLNIVHQGEYYALFLFATVGMMLMAAATSFLTVFLGIETLSLALYILCSFVSRRRSSQESGIKYFLLSSFASAFLLYGIALIYGATGNTSFIGIARFLGYVPSQPRPILPPHQASTLLLIAMGLLAVGFAFKVSAIPFQAWTPDVYDGAPAPVTAFMSVGTKAAALIAFARVFDFVLYPVTPDWMPTVWAITVLTIVGGNILALVQSNVKRLLAYSSIAHAGYLLIGIVAGGIIGVSAILFYLLCYAFMNLGAFGIVSLLERADNSGNDAKDIRGLWYRQPVLAGVLAFFMLALAGFPPMSGFAGKYYIFYAALQGGHPELLVIGVLASVLGMYYYLRVIATMFMEKEVVPASPVPSASTTTSASRRPSARAGATASGSLTSTGAATAVAVRTSTGSLPKTSTTLGKTVEGEQVNELNWLSWASIWIAVAGTLIMGTVLPFWLVALAQQAAQMMLR